MKQRDKVKEEIEKLMNEKNISSEELNITKKEFESSTRPNTPSNPISEKLNSAKRTLNEGSGVTRGTITQGSIIGGGRIIGEGKSVSKKIKSITGSPVLGRGEKEISDRIFNRGRRKKPRKEKEKEKEGSH